MTTLAEVLFAHTGETCGSGCAEGFGYHDCDSTEERRRGCDHLAQVIRDHLTALAGDAGVREVVVRALEDETGRQMLAAWKGEIPAESVEFDFPADAAAAVAAFLGCVE